MLWLSDKIDLETAIRNSKILRSVMKELEYNESKSVRKIGTICNCRDIISVILSKMYNEGIVDFMEEKQNKKIYFLNEKGKELLKKIENSFQAIKNSSTTDGKLEQDAFNNSDKTDKELKHDTQNSDKTDKELEQDAQKTKQDAFKISVVPEIIISKLEKELELLNITDLEKLKKTFEVLIFSNEVYVNNDLKRYAYSKIKHLIEKFISHNKNKPLSFLFQAIFWLIKELYYKEQKEGGE